MADKITLGSIASFQNDTSAVTQYNANNALITTALNNTLSRDGTSPNQMSSALDLNGNVVLNNGGIISTTGVTWTPALTFATPGNLAVTYTTQLGRYWQLSSNLVLVYLNILTSSFTYTTSTGTFQITGLPFTGQNTAGLNPRLTTTIGGINKVGYTTANVTLPPNTNNLLISAWGMNQSAATVQVADVPTGTTVQVTAEGIIFI